MITYLKEKEIYKKKKEINRYLLLSIIVSNFFNIIYSYYTFNNKKIPENIVLLNILIYIWISILFVYKAHQIKDYAETHKISLHDLKIYNKSLIIVFIFTGLLNISINLIQKNIGLMLVRSFLSIIFFLIIWFIYKFLY